jgi:hypothetical protein
LCSVGFYCPQGSISALPCPPGTFGSANGLTAEADCSPCYGGWYCQESGQAAVTDECDAGFYCVQNSNTATPTIEAQGETTDFLGRTFPVGDNCAMGGWCDRGTKFPRPCPPGFFNDLESITTSDDC